MPKQNEKHGKDERDSRLGTSGIPDPARRNMIKRLGGVAVALPAAAVLLSGKSDKVNPA